MRAGCYLVLAANTNRAGKITGFRITRATQRVPSLSPDEARVYVTVEADDSIFDPEAVAVIVTPRMVALAAEGSDAEDVSA